MYADAIIITTIIISYDNDISDNLIRVNTTTIAEIMELLAYL